MTETQLNDLGYTFHARKIGGVHIVEARLKGQIIDLAASWVENIARTNAIVGAHGHWLKKNTRSRT